MFDGFEIINVIIYSKEKVVDIHEHFDFSCLVVGSLIVEMQSQLQFHFRNSGTIRNFIKPPKWMKTRFKGIDGTYMLSQADRGEFHDFRG